MKIVWSEHALADLREIKDWLSRDSAYYALRVIERILDVISSLEIMPDQGHAVPEATNKHIREIHMEPYRIIYKVSEYSVDILTIVHMARNLGELPNNNET